MLSKTEFTDWLHNLMKDKVFIAGYAMVFFALIILERGHAVPNFSQIQHASYVLAWVLIFYAFYYFVGPHLFYWAMKISICVFWVVLGSYLTILFLKTYIATYVLSGGNTLKYALQYYITSAFISSVVTYAIFFHFRAQAKYGFGYDPLQYLFKRPPELRNCPIQNHLNQDVRGKILRLKSQNQYVEVTTENGSQLIRMTLKHAVELLDSDAGLLVHRSRWLSESEIREIVYRNGNPFVVTSTGEEFSISRKMVSQVKDVVEQRKAYGNLHETGRI